MSEYLRNESGLMVIRQLTQRELRWFKRLPSKADEYLLTGKHSINGIHIDDLEKFMKPGGDSKIGLRYFGPFWHFYMSYSGFLGPSDLLIDTIHKDTHTVFGLGLTHANLADFLTYFEAARNFAKPRDLEQAPEEFEFNGRVFRYEVIQYVRPQLCPFNDTEKTDTDCKLIWLEGGVTLEYSGLMPHLIAGHGFYEGKGSPYRLNPEDIIRIGDLTSSRFFLE